MAFSPAHYGLYFTPEHVRSARRSRNREPFASAYTMLHDRQQSGAQQAQWLALRYRFDEATHDGAAALADMLHWLESGLSPDWTYIQGVQETLVLAHTLEMLRDHPALTPAQLKRALELMWGRVAYFDDLDYDRSYVETVWTALLHVVGGIVLEQEAMFLQGAAVYEAVVREDIHPQGYIAKVVEIGDGGGLYRQLLTVGALALMAEAAEHAGVNLWGYEVRGVAAMTALLYPVYYYFLPERWRWDDQVTTDPFIEFGGPFEIVYRRNRIPDLRTMLDHLRPVYDAPGGGLTTLSHGVKVPRRWFFR